MNDKKSLLKKPIEQMTDHEMLVELMNDKRRQDRNRYIKYGIWAAIGIAIIVLLITIIPPIVSAYRQLNEAIMQIQTGIDEVSSAAENAKEQLDQGLQQFKDIYADISGKFENFNLDELKGLAEAGEQLKNILDGIPNIFK